MVGLVGFEPTTPALSRRCVRDLGGVAQLGEHLLCKQGVIGSIPFTSTTEMLK